MKIEISLSAHDFSIPLISSKFLKLLENNSFEELDSEQFYDEKEEQFLPDRFLIGTFTKCGFEESYGDQCEKCGTSHNP